MTKLFKYLPIYCLLLTAYCLLLYSYPPGWSDDILINQDTVGAQKSPDIDVDSQNNVWICWDDATWTEGEIYYSKRDSLGICIIPETIVSNNASRSIFARIANDHSDNVQFIWRDQTPQGIGIWHAKLANDGSVIVPSHLAVNGGGGMPSSLIPEIVLDKYQDINIIWDEIVGTDNRVVYTKLDTLGNIIIEKLPVTLPGHDGRSVGIGIDSFANSHLAYRGDTSGASNKLTYSKIDKDGNIIILNKIIGDGTTPAIVCDQSQNIHIAYVNPLGPGSRVEYLKLNQNGEILIGPDTLSIPELESNTYPHMAIDSLQCLHVVWETTDSLSTVWSMMYCKLDTMGNFIIPSMKIVYPPYTLGVGGPRIAVDRSNRLHVAWMDNRFSNADIFYKRGENETGIEGTTQSKPTNLSKISVSPNPFSKETKIYFSFTQGCKNPKIAIFDISGRKAKQFILDQSNGVIMWRGTDDLGHKLPVGVYFVRLETPNKSITKKIIKLK